VWPVLSLAAVANTATYAHHTLARPARAEYDFVLESVRRAAGQGQIEAPVHMLIPGLKPGYPHDEYGHLSSYYTTWGNRDAVHIVNIARDHLGYPRLAPSKFAFSVGEKPEKPLSGHWVIDFYPLAETGLYFKHDPSR
jgi:hypothetical protein